MNDAARMSTPHGAGTCPQVSIIIPTYNRRTLVVRAIESVFAQAGGACCEVIVVDDGSTDGSPAALAERYRNEPRLRVLQAAHRGPSAARNLGFGASRGQLICFLDSDDRLLPHALQRVLDVFTQRPEIAFLSLEGASGDSESAAEIDLVRRCPGWHSAAYRTNPRRNDSIAAEGAPARGIDLLCAEFFPAILDGDLFYLSGLFIRRAAVEHAGPFAERYRLLEDWDFHARLSLQGVGGLLAETGFLRDVGHDDQLSRRLSPLRHALMHVRVLRNLQRSGLARRRADRERLRAALRDTRYWLGRILTEGRHRRFGRRLLLASLAAFCKPLKSTFLIARSHLHTLAHGA